MVGVQLASELGVGVATDVIAVDPAEGGVTVKQETETGYNVIEMTTPCVVTIMIQDTQQLRQRWLQEKLQSMK